MVFNGLSTICEQNLNCSKLNYFLANICGDCQLWIPQKIYSKAHQSEKWTGHPDFKHNKRDQTNTVIPVIHLFMLHFKGRQETCLSIGPACFSGSREIFLQSQVHEGDVSLPISSDVSRDARKLEFEHFADRQTNKQTNKQTNQRTNIGTARKGQVY